MTLGCGATKKAVSLPELDGPVKKWALVLGAVVTVYLSVNYLFTSVPISVESCFLSAFGLALFYRDKMEVT